MTRVRTVLVGVLLCAASGASGQTVLGVVRDEATRAPVEGAEVVLVRGGQVLGRPVPTDTAGVFRLAAAGAGQLTLRVRHIAYATFDSAPFELRGGETITVDIAVAVAGVPLEPLVVRARTTNARLAGFHERRLMHSFGRFLTREEIDRRGAARTSDLLRNFPGLTITQFRVRGGRARYRVAVRGASGTCEPAIYIDGVRVTQAAESTIDDMLSPNVIEGVEVYTTSITAPAQYLDQGACGVVLFWTRSGEGGSAPWHWKRLLVGAAAVLAVVLLAR